MKKLLLYFVIAVAVVAGVLYWVNMQNGAPESAPTPSLSMAASPTPSVSRTPRLSATPTPTPTPVSSVHTVLIQNFAFSPASLIVKQGDVVVFKNMDSMVHTATSVNGAFNSGPIAAGAQFTLTTASLAPGTYPYHCSFHTYMQGTLVVQ